MKSQWGHLGFLISKENVTLVALVALAVGVRVPQIIFPYVINLDAIDYINSAKALTQGRWIEGFQSSHASLFPVLVSLVGLVTRDWILAGRAVSFLFGVVTVVPLYSVARKLVPWPWGAIPPLFYCLSPTLTHYSTDVIRDPVSWFLIFTSVWIIFKASESKRNSSYLLAGILLLLATANRLDGLIALGAVLVWRAIIAVEERSLRRFVGEAAFILLPSMTVLFAIFLFFRDPLKEHDLLEIRTYERQLKRALSNQGGIHQKENVEKILDGISHGQLRQFFSSAWENRYLFFLCDLLKHWVSAAHPALLIFSLLGFAWWKGWRKEPRWWLLFLIAVFWLIVAYIRLSGAFAISRRHLGPLVLSGYMFAPLGLSIAREWISSRKSALVARTAGIFLPCLVVLSTLPFSLQPQRTEKMVRRLAGELIKSEGLVAPVVATDHQIIAFYAEGVWFPLKNFLEDEGIHKVDFLVLEDDRVPKDWALKKLEQLGMKAQLVKIVEHSKKTLIVYKILE